MNVTEREYSVFRAIVKGLGVYQLLAGASDFVGVAMVQTGIRHLPLGTSNQNAEYITWGVFHLLAALVLLFGTDAFCRLAFSSPVSLDRPEKWPDQSPGPRQG